MSAKVEVSVCVCVRRGHRVRVVVGRVNCVCSGDAANIDAVYNIYKGKNRKPCMVTIRLQGQSSMAAGCTISSVLYYAAIVRGSFLIHVQPCLAT